MYGGLKTSLLSLICGAAVSAGAFAAPTVRTIGGNGTYTSTAAATSSRAGSLRTTGTSGGLRPSVSVSGAANSSGTTTGTTAGTSVSTGIATAGRVASSPRLSIGKYIGAPTSVSTTPSGDTSPDLLPRIEKLEADVSDLEANKQDNLDGSEYIYIENDSVILDVAKLQAALDIATSGEPGRDGREVQMGTNDDGILWHYVGETDWNILITWDAIRSKLNISAINQEIADLTDALNRKLDKQYDVSVETGDPTLVNKALIVSMNGAIQPLGEFVSVDQGRQNENKILVVDGEGRVTLGDDQVGSVTNQDLADLGLKRLAYENSVTTPLITDSAVDRAKLADDIARVISWIEWWKKNAPGDITIDADGKMTGDGMQYVLSVDANGNAKWFKVITEPGQDMGDTDDSDDDDDDNNG